MIEKGAFVVSLDYELMWGGLDIWSEEDYGKSNIAHVAEVIQRLIALFEQYHVKATFATVGLIMHKSKTDAQESIPKEVPSYDNNKLFPYGKYLDGISDNNLYFAPNTITLLKASNKIEIGTQTYSHYYCWEKGQTIKQFECDIKKAIELAKRNNINLKSIVFPRNQVSAEYLNICKQYGINIYRGNALKYFSEPKNRIENYKNKICRLLDAYINISGRTSFKFAEIKEGDMLNVRASRILRPYSNILRHFESQRLKRIKNEITYAAKNKEIYHLWFHPHNFGCNMDQNILFLEEILKHYSLCRDKYEMMSMTMSDFENI